MIADDGFSSVAVEVGFDGCNDLDFERLRDACPFPFKGAARAPNRRLRAVRVLRRSLPVIQAVLVEEIVEWLRVRALGGRFVSGGKRLLLGRLARSRASRSRRAWNSSFDIACFSASGFCGVPKSGCSENHHL
jgi:hypothetical protein